VRHEVLSEVARLRLTALTLVLSACTTPSASRSAATVTIPPEGDAEARGGVAIVEAGSSRAGDEPARKTTGEIAWETDEREARTRALRRGVPLLIYMRAAWAAAAVSMERAVWTDPRLARATRGLVALELDVTSAEGDAELYAQRYAVTQIPSTLVFDASGKHVATVPGAATAEALLEAIARADD
jgi:thiol:disulfide interchange protein